jgi:4-amino-4-deoxychorismate lyase
MSVSSVAQYWLDGCALSGPSLSLHPESPSLRSGEGWFETVRVHAGRALRIDAHLRRLIDSALSEGDDRARLRALLERAMTPAWTAITALECARLRLTLLPAVEPHQSPQVLVALSPYEEPSRLYQQGARVITSKIRHPGLGILGKSLSYHWSTFARRETARVGADEALLGDEHGLLEASTASLLWSENGRWCSTSGQQGCLPSVTIEGLRQSGLMIEPRGSVTSQNVQAEGLLLVSALRLVVPVAALDGAVLPDRVHCAQLLRERLLEDVAFINNSANDV